MASPYRHLVTGIYWFRRRVPSDLWKARDRLGEIGVQVPSHLKMSLKTREPGEAKRRCHETEQGWERAWAEWRRLLKGGPAKLTQKDVFAISAQVLARLREAMSDDPGDADQRELMRECLEQVRDDPHPDELAYYRAVLNVILPKIGLPFVDAESMTKLVRQFANDAPLAAGDLARMAAGDYSESEWLAKRPKRSTSSSSPGVVTIESLIVGWQNEMPAEKRNADTERTYRYKIADFRAGLGHDDASRITADDVMAWHDRMLAVQGPDRLSNVTIKGKLQALSTILAYGVRKRKLASNAALGIRVRTDGQRKRMRGFDTAEMQVILSAARTMTKAGDAVRRWAPWVMAYTGARIGEVARLRCEDVIKGEDGEWQITFTPKAGRLKTEGSERTIPMHPALVAEGFPEYVDTMRETAARSKGRRWPHAEEGRGRVFPFLYVRDGDNSPQAVSGRAQDRTQRWIFGEKERPGKSARRGLLKRDPDGALGPNHGWRHAFKTMCREAGVDQECRDAIEGHATNGVAPNYGEWTVAAMRRELGKVPAIAISTGDDA